jgi:pimeloyl-ACP methyl ester carboxylesterase
MTRLLVACFVLGASTGVALASAAGGPRLAGAAPCPGQAGFECSTLTVPLDYSGRTSGTLRLAVAARRGGTAPRGVLLVLTGGPGQPGVPYIARLSSRLGPVAQQYRIVMIDQRGTGAGALQCPGLQAEMGFSDLQPPTAAAVRACARAIGPKRTFFGTDDVVRDLDRLRQALGVPRLAIDGTSYGTYVAERFALAYPDHVSRLVLDSVVPQDATGMLETEAFPRVSQVLRNVCGGCAGDLAAVLARDHDGPKLLDTIVAFSVLDPTYRGLPEALHAARLGRPQALQALLRDVNGIEAQESASELSQGLHASTLCEDWRFPWGSSSAPLAGRSTALKRYADALPTTALGPFDRATVTGNGIMQQCLYWPPTAPTPQPAAGAKILAPALLLAGDRDLSTPLPWPKAELKLIPRGKLVIVRGSGHSTQRATTARAAVQRFLLGG